MPEPTILRFVQILPDGPPDGNFLLRDLPGSGKRIDVFCRNLAACFDWGPMSWPKSNLEVIAVIGNTRILTFTDPKEQTPLGEVGWGEAIRNALRGRPPGFIDVREGSLDDLIKQLKMVTDSTLWVLEREGASFSTIWSGPPTTQNSFMLGDHRGFDSQTVQIISQHNIHRISLGSKSYLSSHCLAAIISEFERMVR